jgi:hypothetical protein
LKHGILSTGAFATTSAPPSNTPGRCSAPDHFDRLRSHRAQIGAIAEHGKKGGKPTDGIAMGHDVLRAGISGGHQGMRKFLVPRAIAVRSNNMYINMLKAPVNRNTDG